MKNDVDYKALFIGDMAENGDFYKDQLMRLVEDHLGWRKNYFAGDLPAIKEADKLEPGFIATQDKIVEVFNDLDQRLRTGSIPWHNAGRYLGQMNSETLMPSLVAYHVASLWNPNNVALGSSMATSRMEADVADDFAQLFEFPSGWGHIAHDGSLANLEGLWYARCIKSIPLAVKEVLPAKVAGKSDWQLYNMSVEEILDLAETLSGDELDQIKARSSRSGKGIENLGKWIVPQTKHYSWLKACDISGVGLDNMVQIPVQENYRMDIDALEKTIRELVAKEIPILGVVSVVGSTEEGAVDEVHKVVALREQLKKEGIYFYLHIDAAYGGYGRALFLDENNKYVDYADLDKFLKDHNVFHTDVNISEDVYNGYKAIRDAESVTIDPHKMGYVPYSAGGIAIKYKSMRNFISYFAPYVFEKDLTLPDMMGAYILGGSKAGATAAAVWTAHRIVPLNVEGYGRLVASSMEAAKRLRDFLTGMTFNVNGKVIEVYPLSNHDFNMVDWVLKVKGETDLAKTNLLNEEMWKESCYLADENVYNNAFITSHTTFATDGYGDSPLPFVKSMGFSEDEWKKVQQVTLLRAAIMTPYLNDDEMFEYYANEVKKSMQQKLEKLIK